MPLYDIVVISRVTRESFATMRALSNRAVSLVTANGGLVRALDYEGEKVLPQRMKSQIYGYQTNGDYWTMRFDANPPTVKALSERLRTDPNVIRSTVLRVGAKAQDVLTPPEDKAIKYSRISPYNAEAQTSQPQRPSPSSFLGLPGRS